MVYACVSPALTLASSRRGGHRVVIPRGTMWRAPSIPYCARLQQFGVVLGGPKPVHVCAARRGGLLRYVKGAGACHAREFELLVAAHPLRHRQPPRRRVPPCCKRQPEPTFVPVAESQTLSTPEEEPVSATLAGHLVDAATGVAGGPVLSFAIVTTPAHGTLTGIPPYVVYTPAPGFHGGDSFTFTADLGAKTSAPATVSIAVAHVNHAPVLTLPGEQATGENTALVFSAAGADAISVGDEDSEGGVEQLALETGHGTLKLGSTATLASVEGQGTAKVLATGTIAALQEALETVSYAPAPGYSGSDLLKLKIDDLGHSGLGGAKTASASIPITVTTVVYDNAAADSYSTNENEALNVAAPGVLANDTDSEGLPLSAEVVKGPEHGSLTLGADGSFEYAPAHDYAGSDSFTYLDQDGNSPSNVATVTLTVNRVVFDSAAGDSYSTHEGTKLEVSAPGVLANDTDSDLLPLKAVLVSGPAHGTLALQEDGSFEYTPAAGYHGPDSFAYKDNDTNSDSNTATVTLTVEQVDRAPSVNVPASQSTAENLPLAFSTAGANAIAVGDADSEGEVEQVKLAVAQGTLTPGSTGALTVTGSGSAKVTLEGTIAALNAGLEGLSYTPTHDYHGGDSLEVEVNDLGHTGVGGPLTASASIPITVTTVVYDEAVNDSYAASEGTELKVAAPGVLANDKDSDTPELPLEVKEVTKQPQHGSVTVNPDGSFAYTPENGYGGSDSFSYKDTDGNSESNEATVTVEVNAHANEAPLLTVPGAQEVAESTSEAKTSLVFSAAKADAVSLADADSEGGSERLKLTVVHGTLAPGGETGLTVTGSGTATLTLEGTVAAIDAGLEGLAYKPTVNYSGADSLSLEADDLGHSGAGGAKTDSSSVAITVKHPDPIPTNPTYSGAIGNTELSVGVGGSGPDVQLSGSVLPGTTEADGSTLKATAGIISTEHGGSVSMNEDGTFTYQPPVGYDNASDSFQYTETDSAGGKATGTATIKIANARVWYVNDSLAPAGDGESNSPFKALSSVGSASTASGDTIFLYAGSATYTGGIKLKAGQKLEGQSQGLTVEGHALVAASGANPAITNTTAEAPGISLASGDAVKGITVESSAGDGIKGAGVNGEVTIANDTIKNGAEDGIDLIPASSGTLTLEVAHDVLAGQHRWAIDVTSGSGATVLGRIANNTIGEASSPGSGAREDGGIGVTAAGESDTTTVKISENSVQSISGGGYGVWLNATHELVTEKSGAILNATVFGNTIEMRGENSLEGLFAESGNGPSDPETLCLNATKNTIKAAGKAEPAAEPAPFNADPVLLDVKAGSTFKVQGVGGTASIAEVETLLEKENALSSLYGEALVFVEAQKSFASGTCPEP